MVMLRVFPVVSVPAPIRVCASWARREMESLEGRGSEW